MSPQSHGQQLLEALYRRLLGRALDVGAYDWISGAMELLPQRVLMSFTPLGAQFQINTTTSSTQQSADIVVTSSGSAIAVWASNSGSDSDGWGVYGQRYDNTGASLGSEFRINQTTTGDQNLPHIAVDGSGNFVVTWTDNQSGLTNVFARLFNANGTAAGNEFIASSVTAGNQQNSDVAMESGGTFIIAWDGSGAGDGSGIYARAFQANGTALGSDVLINSTISGTQSEPAIAMSTTASGVIAWTDGSGATAQIRGRRIGASAATDGSEFLVGFGAGTDNESSASVGMDSSGNFAIALASNAGTGTSWDIVRRRYDSSGTALDASPVLVNTQTLQSQTQPSLAMRADGAFVVAWQSQAQDTSGSGVFAQEFASDGSASGVEFRANTTISNNQQRPAAAWSGTRLAIVWDGNGPGDSSGAYGQFYDEDLAPNQPPVNTVPSAQTIAEDTGLGFSTVAGNAITIADPNAGSLPVQVTLSVTSGTLTLGSGTGLTFTTGGGEADTTLVFTGTLTAINAAMNGMSFAPAADFNGVVTLTVTSNDLGNGGTGGPLTDTDTVTINVTAVNDAPTINEPTTASTNEDTPLVFSSANGNAISVGDVDADSGLLKFTISASDGTLTLSSTAGLTFNVGNGSADTTMTITGTLTAINTALNGLTFSPTANSSDPVVLSYTISDQGNSGTGGTLTDSSSTNLTINPVNDAPVLSGTHDFSQIDEDEPNNTGNLVSSLIAGKITDSDGPSDGVAVTAVDNTHGTWQFSTNGGTSWTNFGNVSASSARLLASDANTRIRFVPVADYNGTISAGITFRAWDQSTGTAGGTANTSTNGGGTAFSSATASADIKVRAVNDAPVNTVPSNVSVNEDSVLTFSGSKLISVADVDAGTDTVSVALSATSGTLTLATTINLSFAIGDGTADASMYFSGTLTAINAALNGMTFTPTANFNGFAGFAIGSNDNGNNGAGGQQTDNDAFAISVNAVNDPPVNSVPGTQTAGEDTPFTFGVANSNAITVSDVEATSLRVTLHANGGTVTLPSLIGLTMVSGDGTADKDVTFDGTPTAINAALDGLIFTPTANIGGVGAASLQVTTNDRGQSGGGAQSDSDTITIDISDANDAPTINAPSSQAVLENTSLVFSNANKITIADVDAGNAAVQVTLSMTHGVLTLSTVNGLSFAAGDGTADAAMTFTGTISAINSALNNLTFTPTPSFLGNGVLSISVNDQGNSGVGGAQTGSTTVPIEVVTEFRANTATSNTQQQPAVAIDSNGNFIAVWSGNQNTDEISGYGIWAQLFDSLGAPVGGEIHINATTANDQVTPVVGMDSAGNFVVAWASSGQDGNGWGVYARRFAFDGTALGSEIAVNTTTSGNQDQPAIAVAPDGSFVVAWRNNQGGGGVDVYARRFTSSGSAAGGEFRVNTNITDKQDQPAIAMNRNGDFAVAWKSNKQDGSGGGVFARLYDSAGNALTGELAANTTNSGTQDKPTVAMANDGSVIVAWASGNDQDGDKRGVYARRFDGFGTALSGEFLVNATTANDQDVPTVAVGGDGAFTIAWASTGQDGSGKGIYAQKYDSSGRIVGSEFRVSGTAFGAQDQPAAAISAAGDLVVLWQGNGIDDTAGIFGQFYRSANHAPLNTVPSAQTTNEDTPLTFSSGKSNAITIGGGSGTIQVTIAVTHGTATLSTLSGLTFIVGDGSTDDAMTFTGVQGAINAALAGLRFDPDPDFYGTAQLRVTTTDSSSGNTLSDQDTVGITVAPVNDAPITSGLANVNTTEDHADIPVELLTRFGDVEDDATLFAFTVAANTNSALFDSLSINPGTHQLVLKLAHDASGSASITIRATDTGGLYAEATFAVNVAAENDAPILATNAGTTVDQGAAVAITTAMLRITDVDNTAPQLTYTITSLPASGAVELNGTALTLGQTFTQADINAGLMRYRHGGSSGASDTFGFGANDGSGGTIGTSHFDIAVETTPTQPEDPDPESPTPTPSSGGPATPPAAPAAPPSSSGSDSGNTGPLEVDTTENGNGNGGTGGTGGSGPGEGGGGPGGAPAEASHSSGSGGGSGSSASSGADTAAQPSQDAAPTAAQRTQESRDAEANAKQQQPALIQKDNNIAASAIETLRPPPPPVASPVAVAPPPPPAAPVAFIAASVSNPDSVMTKQLDELHNQVTEQKQTIRLVAGSATVVSLGLSVLYILWTIRAGYLLAGLLSSMPAWTFVDPLPILDHFDDALERRRKREEEDGEDSESLESLVHRQSDQGELS